MKILILISLVMLGCKKEKIDLTGKITPHHTKPLFIHDINTCDLDFDQVEFAWHLRHLTGKEWEGSTLNLPDGPLVCNTLDDVNRHLAWVERHTRPVVDAALKNASVPTSMAKKMAPEISNEIIQSHRKYFGAFLDKEYIDEHRGP